MSKVINYTAEATAVIVEGFKAGVPVPELASKVGRSERSVVAKLSREGVYVGKSKAAKAEGKVTKVDLIAKIAGKVGVDPSDLESLEKATKPALEALVEFVEA